MTPPAGVGDGGVSEGIDAAAPLDDGDEVLIPNPGYVAGTANASFTGPVTTAVEDQFEVKAAAIEAALTPRS
jgi:aspartate/methionine/tyrosine aminotransferase